MTGRSDRRRGSLGLWTLFTSVVDTVVSAPPGLASSRRCLLLTYTCIFFTHLNKACGMNTSVPVTVWLFHWLSYSVTSSVPSHATRQMTRCRTVDCPVVNQHSQTAHWLEKQNYCHTLQGQRPKVLVLQLQSHHTPVSSQKSLHSRDLGSHTTTSWQNTQASAVRFHQGQINHQRYPCSPLTLRNPPWVQ